MRAPVRPQGLDPSVTLDREMDLEKYLEDQRMSFMREALRRTGGVQSHAARLLCMSFRSFRYFAKKHDLGDHGDAVEPEMVEVGRGGQHRG